MVVTLVRKMNFKDEASTCLLVTGGMGFIGSHFINDVHARYTHVRIVNLDVMHYCAKKENVTIPETDLRHTFVMGDICDEKLVSDLLTNHRVTHLIHFAAQSHVQNSFRDGKMYVRDNVLGTYTLLECARDYGKLELFMHVSTDEVYGDVSPTANCEKSTLYPTNPYAATKAAAEMLTQAYYCSYRIPIVVTRSNNVYGRGQYKEKLIPRFIHQLVHNRPMTIQGDGSCLRSFLHVSDVTAAFIILLEQATIGDVYNIGIANEVSVLDVAKVLLAQILPGEVLEDWVKIVPDRPYNDKRYFINSDKLHQLGWAPKISFTEGIRMLCEEAVLLEKSFQDWR